MAAYPAPPPVILLPESIAVQAAYAETLLLGSAPTRAMKCFQVLGLSPSLPQDPML